MDDADLLNAYADHQDHDAFAHLVRRHTPWLYAAARRQLGDGHLAEDVTQAVFLLLSRRARKLRGHTYLSGWLFVTMGYCIRELQRQRSRQERREQEAATMRPEKIKPEANWNEIAPMLEAAVGRLGRADRDAVLLRFYEQEPLAEVGRLLGVSEDAARKRVDRAIGKLRQHLAARGIGALSLSTLILAHAVEGGSAGLAEKITASIGQGMGNSTAGGIAQGTAKMMTLAKAKVVAAIVLGILGVGVAGGLAISSELAGGEASSHAARAAGVQDKGGGRVAMPGVPNEGLECMRRMRDVSGAILQYSYQHEMHLPSDLGATLEYLKDWTGAPGQPVPLAPEEKAKRYLCPAEATDLRLPAEVTPEWVNQQTSFVYLGNADIVASRIPGRDQSRVILLYDKSERGHADIKGRYPAAFLDGHAEALDREELQKVIAESRKLLDAARTSGRRPTPRNTADAAPPSPSQNPRGIFPARKSLSDLISPNQTPPKPPYTMEGRVFPRSGDDLVAKLFDNRIPPLPRGVLAPWRERCCVWCLIEDATECHTSHACVRFSTLTPCRPSTYPMQQGVPFGYGPTPLFVPDSCLHLATEPSYPQPKRTCASPPLIPA